MIKSLLGIVISMFIIASGFRCSTFTPFASGDIIQIERGDGVIFKYKVVENKSVALSEADSYMKTAMKSPEAGKQSVTLISCTGEWSNTQKTYLSRQFTRAVLVEE